MSTALDTRLAPKILAIVAKYGKSVVFRVPGTKEYDPTTGDTLDTGYIDYTEKVTPPENYSKEWDGNLVQMGDQRIFLPASGLLFEPKKDLRVFFNAADPDNSEIWVVVSIWSVFSGEDIALYGLQLRK